MNLDYLNTYMQVIEVSNFSEVAKKLSISQPAVSFQIQKLERDLGVRLIDRSQKSVTMTDAGKRLLRFAKTIQEEREHLLNDLDRLRETVTGDLFIAASTIPGEVLLLPILCEFRALHPTVGAKAEVFDSGTVVERVRDGAYEIGFCGILPEGKDLECIKVAEDEIDLIVFPEYPFAQRAEVSPPELDGEAVVMRHEMSGTQQNLKYFVAEASVDISNEVGCQ